MATKAQRMKAAAQKMKPQRLPPLPSLQRLDLMPESEPENLQEATSIPLPGGGGDDDFAGAAAADDPEFGPSTSSENMDTATAGPAILSKDEFFAAFKVLHQAPNMVPLPPFPLRSLPIAQEEMEAARLASDAIYDIAADTPWLRWIIEPQSLWMQRGLVIAAYAIPKAMAINAELAAKRARSVDPEPAPQAAAPHEPAGEATGFTGLSE